MSDTTISFAGAETPLREVDPARDRLLSRAERSALTADLLARAEVAVDQAEREELLSRVVLVNQRVAEAVAGRYRNRGISDDDLRQTAYVGLTKAVYRFDHTRRGDLLSYAVPTIRGELQRHFRDHGWTVRPPRRVQDLQAQVNRTIEALGQDLGHEPDAGQVRDRLGISEKEYDEAMLAFGCFQPASLDQPVSATSSTTVGDLIESDEQDLATSEARVRLAPVVKKLSARDQRIVYLRFYEDRTQEEIGLDLGITQMQVSRLLTRILGQLREQVV